MSNDSFTMTVDENNNVEVKTPEVVDEATATPTLMRQVIENSDARNIVRAFKYLARIGVGVMPVCLVCQQNKKPELCSWIRHESSGEIALGCGCTVREFRDVVK